MLPLFLSNAIAIEVQPLCCSAHRVDMQYSLFHDLFIKPLFVRHPGGVSVITCSYASALRGQYDSILRQLAVSSSLVSHYSSRSS